MIGPVLKLALAYAIERLVVRPPERSAEEVARITRAWRYRKATATARRFFGAFEPLGAAARNTMDNIFLDRLRVAALGDESTTRKRLVAFAVEEAVREAGPVGRPRRTPRLEAWPERATSIPDSYCCKVGMPGESMCERPRVIGSKRCSSHGGQIGDAIERGEVEY